MSFDPMTEIDHSTGVSSAVTASRMKRQLTEQAIDAARRADWAAAAETNEKILEMGPDSSAENRLAKALWEQGELAKNSEALAVNAKWRKSSGCASKAVSLTRGDLALRLKG